MDKRQLKKCELIFRDDGLLEMNYFKDAEINEEDAISIIHCVRELIGGISHTNLVDLRKLKYISNNARKVFAEHKDITLHAVAILIRTSVQKVFANIYFKFSNPKTTTKVFTEKEEAVDWLKEQIK